MPSESELEVLARLVGGALEPDEAREVERRIEADPALAAAFRELTRLEALGRELPTTLPDVQAERLVSAALAEGGGDGAPVAGVTPRPRRWTWQREPVGPGPTGEGPMGVTTRPRRWPRQVEPVGPGPMRTGLAGVMRRSWPGVVALVAASAAVAFIAGKVGRPAETTVVVVGGPVTVDGAVLGPGERSEAARSVRVGPGGAAVIEARAASLLLPAGAEVVLEPGPRLVSGAVVVRGRAELEVRGVQVAARGDVVVAMEPPRPPVRVTDGFDPEVLMSSRWMTVGVTAVVSAGLATLVTVAVLRGEATVAAAGAGEAPVVVPAGATWRSGDGSPAGVPAAAVRAPVPVSAKPAGAAADLATMSREELVATVEALRDEKERLLAERAELRREREARDGPSDEGRRRNYYRLEPEELAAAAERGQLRLRGPQPRGTVEPLPPSVRSEAGLTDAEAAVIDEVLATSTTRANRRLHELYEEIGGDPRVGATLSTQALLSELNDKSTPGAFDAAVRQLARERAGLATAPAEQSAILRALRALADEDAWVLDELDRRLGPRRAEEILNHPAFPRSDTEFGVGPE